MILMIILTIIFGGITFGCFAYALTAFKEKGPILLNGYVLATSEEKRKLTRLSPERKRKDYHYAGRVFIGLSVMAFVMFLQFLLLIFQIQATSIFMDIEITLSVIMIVYVVVYEIRDGRFC